MKTQLNCSPKKSIFHLQPARRLQDNLMNYGPWAGPLVCLMAFVLVFAVLPAGAQTLLLRYNFDEASGDALDLGLAPAANGTFSGSATRTTSTPAGFSSHALDLSDFSNLPYVTGGSPSKLDGLTNFTLTVWLNLQNSPAAATGGSANRRLLAKQNSGTFEGFSWNLNNSSLGTAYTADNFKMALFVGGANGFVSGITDTTTGADHRWRFLAVTYDGSLTADNVKFYVGDETNAVTQLGSTLTVNGGITSASAAGFKIGNTDAAPTSNTAPPGWLDDARVYAGALDATQLDVVRLAALQQAGPTPVQILNPFRNGNNINFSFQTQSSRTHTVQYVNDLNNTNWQTLQVISGTGDLTNITDAIAGTRFYRVATQ